MQTSYAPAAMTMFETSESVIDVRASSRALTDQLSAYGAYTVECNHGGARCGAPPELQLAAWQFMKDHPFGTGHEGYDGALPAIYPGYCTPYRR